MLSTVPLPLAVNGQTIGAFNLYGTEEDVFKDADVETATLFAVQASVVLANTQAYWDMRTLAEQLTESIESRAVIEQAKGILMATMNCTAAEAFQVLVQQREQAEGLLHHAANQDEQSILEIAQRIIRQAEDYRR